MISDNTFLNICDELAKESHCCSHKVAALAVRNNRILSMGINGSPHGYINCDTVWGGENFDREKHHQWSLIYEIHGESNCINNAAKIGISLDGATMYITMQPCSDCSKNMIAVGIKKIIYRRAYDKGNENSLKLLKECGVEVIHLSI